MARPVLLTLLLLLLPLAWLGYRHWHWQQDALARLGNMRWRLSVQLSRHWANGSTIRWFLAVALGLIALAGPQWGQSTRQIETHGLQLMILLDVSRSMLAEDVPGGRLAQAKEIVETAVASLTEEDQVGLIAFAGETRLLLPLTGVKSQVNAILPVLSPTDFTVQGTVMGPALATAVQSFPYPRLGQPIILVVTDGEEHGGGSVVEVQKAIESSVLVVTVGVGSESGALLSAQDIADQSVMSRLQSEYLQQLARVGNGRYLLGTDAVVTLPGYLQTIRQSHTGTQLIVEPTQRYQLFLLFALLLFCLNWVTPSLPKAVKVGAGFAGLLLFVSGLTACQTHDMSKKITQGNEAFVAATYNEAIQHYTLALEQNPQSAIALFNLANTRYRLTQYQTAVSELQQIADDTPEKFRVDIYFNLGNSYFQMAAYDAAIVAYEAALRLNPDDLEAKHNLELALQMAKSSEQMEAINPGSEESRSEMEDPNDDPSPPQILPTSDALPAKESIATPLIQEDALRIIHGMQADINYLPIDTDLIREVDLEKSPQNDW